MSPSQLEIQVIHSSLLSEPLYAEIVSLCNRAYQEDMRSILQTFADATHILGYYDGRLVCHALWVTRHLQVGASPLLRTAYVEALATDAAYRGRGIAAVLMKRIVIEVRHYDLAALSPFSSSYYERLGWQLWRGPLSIRMGDTSLPSPADEEVMIYRLPQTPALNLTEPLSAEWRAGELW